MDRMHAQLEHRRHARSSHASVLVPAALIAGLVSSNVLAQVPTAAPAAGPIPLEAFTRFDEFGGIKISPDGKLLALQTRQNDQTTPSITMAATGRGSTAARPTRRGACR